MWLLLIPLAVLAAFIGGVFLIINRHKMPWFLWAGIAIIGASILSLPITIPLVFLLSLLVTGGSFV